VVVGLIDDDVQVALDVFRFDRPPYRRTFLKQSD